MGGYHSTPPLPWEAANLFTIFTVINKEKGKLAPASSTASATFAFCWDQQVSYQTGEFLFLLLPEGAKCITGTIKHFCRRPIIARSSTKSWTILEWDPLFSLPSLHSLFWAESFPWCHLRQSPVFLGLLLGSLDLQILSHGCDHAGWVWMSKWDAGRWVNGGRRW